jgi:hypothetical protein
LKPEWWGSPLAQEEKYQGKEDLRTTTTIIIKFFIYLRANLTARRPITK